MAWRRPLCKSWKLQLGSTTEATLSVFFFLRFFFISFFLQRTQREEERIGPPRVRSDLNSGACGGSNNGGIITDD